MPNLVFPIYHGKKNQTPVIIYRDIAACRFSRVTRKGRDSSPAADFRKNTKPRVSSRRRAGDLLGDRLAADGVAGFVEYASLI